MSDPDVSEAPAEDAVRLLPGRADRRRAAKSTCCALCNKQLRGDGMRFRLPDPRPENWGLMTTGEGHASCVALAERRRAEAAERRLEAAERTLAALSDAAKNRHAATENADRQQAMGLWTPR